MSSRNLSSGLLGMALLASMAMIPGPAMSEVVASGGTAAAIAQVVEGIVSYTRWPQATRRRRLCIGADPQYANVIAHGWVDPAGTVVDARTISVEDPDIGAQCDIVYLGPLTGPRQAGLFSALAGHPVLSISEFNPDCSVGSMFCLKITPRHIGFDINLDAVSRSGVRVHPSVLRLSAVDESKP
ncbi:YfiR family protein [Frateuria aurantia]